MGWEQKEDRAECRVADAWAPENDPQLINCDEV
jgi:hypothetical protein